MNTKTQGAIAVILAVSFLACTAYHTARTPEMKRASCVLSHMGGRFQ